MNPAAARAEIQKPKLRPRSERATVKAAPAPRWQARFLAAFRNCGCVRDACEAAGVHRSTVYKAADADSNFRGAWHEAREDAVDLLEAVAWARAREGGSDFL